MGSDINLSSTYKLNPMDFFNPGKVKEAKENHALEKKIENLLNSDGYKTADPETKERMVSTLLQNAPEKVLQELIKDDDPAVSKAALAKLEEKQSQKQEQEDSI